MGEPLPSMSRSLDSVPRSKKIKRRGGDGRRSREEKEEEKRGREGDMKENRCVFRKEEHEMPFGMGPGVGEKVSLRHGLDFFG